MPFKKTLEIPARLLQPVVDPRWIWKGVRRYPAFLRDYIRFRRMVGPDALAAEELRPCIHDRGVADVEPHYFYQGLWAFKQILSRKPDWHLDIGSKFEFLGFLSTITRVVFVDLRPVNVSTPNLEFKKGTITDLPYPDDSVSSISCLHVAEHIGLGRYGDELDPDGTHKAILEVGRVLAPGGHLYFSVPVGRPRICFNAHRVHDPEQIVEYFSALHLMTFAAVSDEGRFIDPANMKDFSNADFACGIYHFTKP